jgi:ParB family chromosome partitioning protein
VEIELWQIERKYSALRITEASRHARVLAALCEHGQQQPVLVVAGAEPERYVLIDGYARVTALAELKRDTVEATVLALTETEALVLAFRLERNRARSAIEEGWLLRELLHGHRVAQSELAAWFGRSPSWVSRRLALVEALPAAVEEAVRDGAMPAQAAMKYLVPMARANAADCERLIANLAPRRLTVRQMARLYVGWRAGNAEQRERIVERPLLYLEFEEREKGSEAPPDPGTEREQRLVRDLGALAGICRRVRQAFGEREKHLPWPALVRFAWQEAQSSFGALVEVVLGGGDA